MYRKMALLGYLGHILVHTVMYVIGNDSYSSSEVISKLFMTLRILSHMKLLKEFHSMGHLHLVPSCEVGMT